MTTYTTSLRQNLLATGEFKDQWGDKMNLNYQIIEQGINGHENVALPSSGTYALTTNNGSTTGDQARQKILNFTGALSGTVNVTVPSTDKLYVVKNSSTGAQTVTIGTSGGTPVTLPNGFYTIIVCDSVDCHQVEFSFEDQINSNALDITGIQGQITALQASIAALQVAAPVFPIGSYYMTHGSTNPNTLLGYGTWVREAKGRAIFGVDEGDSDFEDGGSTGGAKEQQLGLSELPNHSHSASMTLAGSHTHTFNTQQPSSFPVNPVTGRAIRSDNIGKFNDTTGFEGNSAAVTTSNAGAHTHSLTIVANGSSGSFSILPPYHAVYLWRRTA